MLEQLASALPPAGAAELLGLVPVLCSLDAGKEQGRQVQRWERRGTSLDVFRGRRSFACCTSHFTIGCCFWRTDPILSGGSMTCKSPSYLSLLAADVGNGVNALEWPSRSVHLRLRLCEHPPHMGVLMFRHLLAIQGVTWAHSTQLLQLVSQRCWAASGAHHHSAA